VNSAEGLDKIFRPKSIAVVGATSRPGTIGREILHNLVLSDFKGQIFPVNPSAPFIHSMKCFPSVSDIPDPVDMAVIVVRKDLVLPVVEECGRKGVGGVVVITAGFKEIGEEGAREEKELLERVLHYRMRMIGPNCFGVINTDPNVTMNATFSRSQPLHGKIGFMSQSGALGEAILQHANHLGLGFSMFASVGNKADIAGNALLNYWRDDPQTQIILLYLESFGDAETFTKIAREISRTKPIIAVKSGKTTAGARATISHTGALAGQDIGVDALFEACGVIRVHSMEELFNLAEAFDRIPAPKGKRVAILTNAGGPGILATDAAAGMGLDVVPLEPKTVAELKSFLPSAAATGNPVDMIASATQDDYRRSLRALFADANVDGVMCLFVPPIMIDEMAVAESIVAVHKESEKPLFACFAGSGTGSGAALLKERGIPVYTFPEEMAVVYERMHRYSAWRTRPIPVVTPTPPAVLQTRTEVSLLAKLGRREILGREALAILDSCGIPTAPILAASDLQGLRSAAKSLGYPVVLKLDATGLVHKTEVGGVITDVRGEDELSRHYSALMERAKIHGLKDAQVVVQSMVKGGVEMVLGMVRDPKFGPMVMCGLGGVFVEVVRDIAFKLPPIAAPEALEMVRGLKGQKLLNGYRGAPPADVTPMVDAVVTLSHLVMDFPNLRELDINPFILCPERAHSRAIDARIILDE
jgi:acetyltransferase